MFETLNVRESRHAAFMRALAHRTDPISRRRFLELMGAPVALAGWAACAPPHQRIVPYVRQPEQVQSGKPLFFATAHVLSGFASGVLVESHFGRPTKIEGNPQHPASLGGTDAFGQASILTLYEPSRAQAVTFQGQISTWNQFQRELRAALVGLRPGGGQGLRFLSESSTSPTLAAQISQIAQQFPAARWHWWEPVNRDNALAGAQLAFGRAVETRYHFDAADVVLSLDGDVFAWDPGRLRYLHDFATRRRPEEAAVTRVYAVESTPSLLGVAADHRLPLPAGAIPAFAFALARALGVDVGQTPVAAPPSGVPSGWLENVATDLRGHGRTSLVVAGQFQPPAVHAVAHAINAALGSVGTTLDYSDPVALDAVDHVASLRGLVDDMQSGQVSLLVILGGNPVYSAPADIGFAAGLERVGLKVHLSLFEDETSAMCQWHLPELHPLETWSDARAFDGTATVLQPLIAPLYSEAHSMYEVLATFSDQPASPGHDIVKGYWQSQHAGKDFDAFWRQTLSDGVVAGSASPARSVSLRPGWASQVSAPSTPQAGSLELVFRPDHSVYDGRFATNAWLLELPRPVTKLSWDNVAMVSPASAEQLGVETGEVVVLGYAGRSVAAPIWVLPGQADGSIAVTLGYGRRRGAGAGAGVGFNANALRTSHALWSDSGLEVTRAGQRHRLVSTQGHYSMEGHELVLTVTPEQLQAAGAGPAVGQQQPRDSMYPAYPYPDNKWGMVIDLNSCVGCNACIVACQAENNIPVVGKEEVG